MSKDNQDVVATIKHFNSRRKVGSELSVNDVSKLAVYLRCVELQPHWLGCRLLNV